MEEFQEDEVWDMVKPSKDKGSNSNSKMMRKSVSGTSSAWCLAATSRAIPRATAAAGGEFPRSAALGPPHQSSAPVNVPDWAKILKKNKPRKNLWDDDACDDDGHVEVVDGHGDDAGGHDDGDDGDETLPPHEFLARRFARTQIASFSMCEGVGRTLKGRDLSNLRNAILTKTGFLE